MANPPKLRYSKTQGNAQPQKGAAASTSQVYQMIMQEAQRRGLSWFKPHHAMGMIGSFVQETGNFRKDVIDFDVRGDDGTAHGLMQWRDVRFDNLKKYAQQMNVDPRDLSLQISFAFEEGSPNSAYKDGGSIRAFNEMSNAQNIEQATVAFVHAERPAGYKSNNPAGAHDINNRISHANKAANVAGAEGFQTSDGAYTFSPNGEFDASRYGVSNSGYRREPLTFDQEMGYVPPTPEGIRGPQTSDFGTGNQAVVNRIVDTSRLFADSVTGNRGRPNDFRTATRNQFGAY